MTVVKINAITVPADSGDELARRFAARAGAVDDQDGFEGFELLKPSDGRTTGWRPVTHPRRGPYIFFFFPIAFAGAAPFGRPKTMTASPRG